MDHPDRYVEHSLRTSMFFQSTRLMVAGNPKAAGTTLRWWLLRAHGVDVDERTRTSWWGESAPYQTVWDDHMRLDFVWTQLPEEVQRDALESEDVLTVVPVRNPVTRAFSAWSGKWLIGEAYYEHNLPGEFPPLPDSFSSSEEIADCFRRFMVALGQVVDDRGFESVDVHLWPQAKLLARVISGRRLELRQEDMSSGFASITEHLETHGVEPGAVPRINETVVPYIADLVDDEALGTIVRLYGDDFVTYGYAEERPTSSSRPLNIDWLNDVRGRNRRYGVIHRALMHESHEHHQLEREIAQSRRREAELTGSTSWKVTGPLRWVSDRSKK
jgi:hypothetical protein